MHGRPLAGEHAANAGLKTACLAAGLAAGADSIDDMDLLRHGAMDKVFGEVRAPSTLGSSLRAFTWDNVSQLQKTHREVLNNLAALAPLLPGAGTVAFIDVDSTQKRVYGYEKEGSALGHTKIQSRSLLVKGLNVLSAAVSTPLAAPVLAVTRLRGGSVGSSRGAASLVKEAISTARDCGCAGNHRGPAGLGLLLLRRDQRDPGAGRAVLVTVPVNSSIRAAIAAIPGDARTPIRYPRAIRDEQAGGWVSDAEVAGTALTRSRPGSHGQAAQEVSGRTPTPGFTCENPSLRQEPFRNQPVDPG